jgi:hypothetical protein
MKKLLIVSLFLLGMIGLMAQTPHLAKFDLQTEAGGYHAAGTIGFKLCVVANGNEMWSGEGTHMYWNWPGGETGENSAPTLYLDGTDPDTPGRISIQMGPITNWGFNPFVGDITANFYFRDADGNETGPYNLSKSGSSTTQYPDVVAWGGPAGPTPVLQWATVVAPEDTATDVALDTDLEWSYPAASDEVLAADGFEVWVNEEKVYDGPNTSYTHTLAYATDYTWYVKPYTLPEAKGLKSRVEPQRDYPEGTATEWTFTTISNIIPEDDPIVVEIENPVIPEIPTIPAGLQYIAVTVNQPTAGLFGVQFTLPQAYGDMRVLVGGLTWSLDTPDPDGQWAEVDGLNVTVWILFAGGAKEAKDIIIVDDSTLPVTLSSFTAVAHANEYVTLKWVTESESNLQGYNVYRAETDNQAQAIRINPTIVAPHNQTQTQTYTYTDNEVESTTYYYWLEVSELANENSFHGPIVVTVEDDPVVPGITETTFRNFGPSPFTTSTSTSLRVKEGETATVTIYNLLGQVVRRESFNAGEHNFEFNGRDANNKKVANGIYFVRMTSPTQTKNFKIVKIK